MTRIRRTLALAVLCAGFVALGSGCRDRQPPTGGATNPKAQAARTQAESYALDAVKGAAAAHVKFDAGATGTREPSNTTPASVPTPEAKAPAITVVAVTPSATVVVAPLPAKPAPRSNIVIRERIATEVPYATEAAADEEALRMAQDRIANRLQELDPPIRYKPSPSVVKNEYIRKESRTVRRPGPSERDGWDKHGFSGDQVYVEYDVEVTAEQIRELRTQERLSGALRGIVGLGVLAFAGFLFLRLDEWTKGYLTSWLAFVAAGLVGGVAAALLML